MPAPTCSEGIRVRDRSYDCRQYSRPVPQQLVIENPDRAAAESGHREVPIVVLAPLCLVVVLAAVDLSEEAVAEPEV